MKNPALLLLAMMSFSTLCFASSTPASVQSLSNQVETYGSSQIEARTIMQLCDLLRPDNTNISFGKKLSKFTCIKKSGGLIELQAQNALGSLSIFANSQDLVVVVNNTGGDLALRYKNNLAQSLYLTLDWTNSGSPSRILGGAKLNGFYEADLTLIDGNSEIRIGQIREFNGQNIYP